MSHLYGPQHRDLQDAFDTRRLADRVAEHIVVSDIADEHRAFIESRDMFFLSTIDHRGYPTCSYKGGERGFVQVLDSKTLAFPSLDGNGMFLSMGNIAAKAKVGLLFIDFETPHRVRVHGDATVSRDDPLLPQYVGAELVVRVSIAEIFINCPRYVHRYERVEASRYVPRADCQTPPAQWKRIDAIQDALPERDRQLAERAGGVITAEQYSALVRKGEA